jgi:hypothetical protein
MPYRKQDPKRLISGGYVRSAPSDVTAITRVYENGTDSPDAVDASSSRARYCQAHASDGCHVIATPACAKHGERRREQTLSLIGQRRN